MKAVMIFFLAAATSFASVDPVKVLQSLAGFAQPGTSAKALAKEAGTAATLLSGSQDPNAVGFWVMDTVAMYEDTISDSIIIPYNYAFREEIYLAADGSFEIRDRAIVTESSLTDTGIGRSLGTWATGSGNFFTQASSALFWSSSTHATTNDSSGGIDTGGYSFLDGGDTKVLITGSLDSAGSNTGDSFVFTKSGTSANFTLQAITSTAIRVPAAKAEVTLQLRMPELFRYQNRYYRISGARAIVPGISVP